MFFSSVNILKFNFNFEKKIILIKFYNVSFFYLEIDSIMFKFIWYFFILKFKYDLCGWNPPQIEEKKIQEYNLWPLHKINK